MKDALKDTSTRQHILPTTLSQIQSNHIFQSNENYNDNSDVFNFSQPLQHCRQERNSVNNHKGSKKTKANKNSKANYQEQIADLHEENSYYKNLCSNLRKENDTLKAELKKLRGFESRNQEQLAILLQKVDKLNKINDKKEIKGIEHEVNCSNKQTEHKLNHILSRLQSFQKKVVSEVAASQQFCRFYRDSLQVLQPDLKDLKRSKPMDESAMKAIWIDIVQYLVTNQYRLPMSR